MRERPRTPELIDLGSDYYTEQEYQACLKYLGRIGKLLGGDRATLWAFDQLPSEPSSILDVGCGGGYFVQRLAKKYPKATIRGMDLSHQAIAFARRQQPQNSQVIFEVPATAHLQQPPKSVDVVTSTLVCHHLSDEQIIDFLQRSTMVAREAVIFNDLHRHVLASWSFAAIAPILFPNRLIFHDGRLSIKKAFTRQQWLDYLRSAGIPSHAYSLSWHWSFRWIVIIYPRKMAWKKSS